MKSTNLIKIIYSLSILFWVIYIYSIIKLGNDNIVPNPYYLKNHNIYSSFTDFISILSDLEKYGLNLFTYCCDLINYLGVLLGYSYQDINIILFVITPILLFTNLLLIIGFQLITIIRLKNKLT